MSRKDIKVSPQDFELFNRLRADYSAKAGNVVSGKDFVGVLLRTFNGTLETLETAK